MTKDKGYCIHCLRKYSQGHACNQRQCRYCNAFHNHILCFKKPKTFNVPQQHSSFQQQSSFQQHRPRQQYPAQPQQKYYNQPPSRNFSQQQPTQQRNVNAVVAEQPDEVHNVTSVVVTPNIPQKKCYDSKQTGNPVTISATTEQSATVLLPVKVLTIESPSNTNAKAVTFFDCGSQQTFIENSKVQELQLQYIKNKTIWIKKFGDEIPQKHTLPEYEIPVTTADNQLIYIYALGIDKITDELPYIIDADALIAGVSKPDILIGSEFFWEFFPCETNREGLRYVNTKVGKIYCGPMPYNIAPDNPDSLNSAVITNSSSDAEDITQTINRFFQSESVGLDITQDEQEIALKMFLDTVEFKDNRFFVSWLYKTDAPELALNYKFCYNYLIKLVRQLELKNLLASYDSIFQGYLKNGYVEDVTDGIRPPDNILTQYVYHRAVIKDSKTTPVRPVFNCSFKASKNMPSFNEQLHCGRNLMPKIIAMLLRFREFLHVCIGDLEKAFYQLRLKPADRDAVRFLWLKNINLPVTPENIRILRHCCPLFGAGCSPYMLAECCAILLKMINTIESLELLDNNYVDNAMWGASTPEEVINTAIQHIETFKTASFNLRELMSNSPQVNEYFKVEPEPCKVLGIKWNPCTDEISIECGIAALQDIQHITKRKILSFICGLYDPLGIISPVVIKFKVFIQQLWKTGRGWDERISTEEVDTWKKLIHPSAQQQITIKRCEHILNPAESQLHIFVDASQTAYGAVAYLRQISTTNKITVSFIMSKTKVAPIKQHSIPKLELLANSLGAEMAQLIQKEMRTKFSSITIYTDNSAVLQWLHQTGIKPRLLANCINKIHNVTRDIRHISTKLNPADPASRGLTIPELAVHQLWWKGPAFLSLDTKYWPEPAVQPTIKADTSKIPDELKYLLHEDELPSTQIYSLVTDDPKTTINFINISKYSSYCYLLSSATNILLFLQKLCSKTGKEILSNYCNFSKCSYLQLRKLAETLLILQAQQQCPPTEQLKLILHLRRDHIGILRCFHRLEKAYPNGLIYLPHGELTELMIMEYHKIYIHAGTKHILNEIRKRFWIHHGRPYITKVIRQRCLGCRRHKAKYFNLPAMPNLPDSRVQFQRPFQHIGIDYCGPFTIKSENGPIKCWIVLFTCLSIRAIHLDLTLGLDAASFLNVFRRFVARRGKPISCLSDHGTNMKAAKPVICLHWISKTKDSFIDYLNKENITWTFTTEHSPWKGATYERLIGLIKDKMKFTIGRRLLSHDTFYTLLTEIEAALNSRPITPVENKWDDIHMLALRPTDFLCPAADNSTPEFEYDPSDPEFELKESTQSKLLNLWKKTTFLLDKFRATFIKDYLHMLREVSSNTHKQNGIERLPVVGEIVLIAEPNTEQKDYKLGIISEIHQSKCDNAIRAATVKTGKEKYLNRPINQLHPLEIQVADTTALIEKAANLPTKDTNSSLQTVPSRVLRPRKNLSSNKQTTTTASTKETTPSLPIVPSNNPRSPQNLKSTFYILVTCLTFLFATVNAHSCPSNDILTPQNVVTGEYCKPSGLLIFKIDDNYCWKNIVCENAQVLRDSHTATHEFCGPPCKCPHWADHCSFYDGEKTLNSTTANPLVQQLLFSAKVTDVIHANTIQLYDHSRHPVSELHLIHQQINMDDVQCYGTGAITGTPAFCSQNACYSNATKFCTYQLQEIVYWSFGNTKVAIKAWGTTTLTDEKEKWQKEPSELRITCENNILSITAKHKMDIIEITSSTSFHAEKVFNTHSNISIPATTLLTDQALSITVLFEDDTTETKPILCSTVDFCEQIRCTTLCWDEILNPTCRPWKSIALAAILIALFWMILCVTVICCCCCRRRRRFTFFGPEGPPTFYSKRKVSDVGDILIRYYPKTKFYFMLATISTLFILVETNAEFTAITAHSRSCISTANGFIDCTFKEASELFIASGTENGLLLKDNEEHPFGTVTISAEIQAICVPEKEHYTRIFKAEVSSSKRCRGAGPCSGLTCAHTVPDEKIEGMGIANLLPGVTNCIESCGCWGCSCFICESACLFYRYFTQPTTKEAIRIFSCSTLTPTVILNITLTTQNSHKTELMYLKNGETSSTMNMEITLLNTFENIHINELNIIQSETRTALLDTFSTNAANLLKCDSKEGVLKLNNCKVSPTLCNCNAADSVAKCNCQDNQILEQALKEYSLPHRLSHGWLRKTQHGVTVIQDGRIQLKLSLQDLQLSTVVDRNRCQANVFEIKGCANCNSGAIINITCKSDFGSALGHVNCGKFNYALQCNRQGVQQTIRIYSTVTEINETCTLQCPAHQSKFILSGLLWNSVEVNPWSTQTGNVTESSFTMSDAVTQLLDFAQQTYTRIAVVLVLAVILILMINRLLFR